MDKHEDWLRSLRNRMTELGWKLALCLSDPECEPEKLAHASYPARIVILLPPS